MRAREFLCGSIQCGALAQSFDEIANRYETFKLMTQFEVPV